MVRRVGKNNSGKATITFVHNLKSHKEADVRAEAKELAIGLVSFLPYCLDPSPIASMWKKAKNVMSTKLQGI